MLRRRGWQCKVVERWNSYAEVRQDLWSADILACHPVQQRTMLVQTTTRTNLAARLAKAKADPHVLGWLRSGGSFVLHGWYPSGRIHRGESPVKEVELVL